MERVDLSEGQKKRGARRLPSNKQCFFDAMTSSQTFAVQSGRTGKLDLVVHDHRQIAHRVACGRIVFDEREAMCKAKVANGERVSGEANVGSRSGSQRIASYERPILSWTDSRTSDGRRSKGAGQRPRLFHRS